MMSVKAILEGDQALMSKFNQLSTSGSARAMRSSLSVGKTILRKAIRGQIGDAKTPGHDNQKFRDAIGARMVKSRQDGMTSAKIGVNVGKSKGWAKARRSIPKGSRRAAYKQFRSANKGNPHFHLLAMGTGVRKTRFGANRGLVRSGNYVPKAVAVSATSAGIQMELKLRERIYAEATKEGI